MKIALFSHVSAVKLESTHITITGLQRELSMRHTVIDCPGRGIIRHVAIFRKLVRKHGCPDIIHTFSAAPLLALKALLARASCPRAAAVHTLKSYSRSIFGGFIFARIFNLVDAVTVPTEVMKAKLIHHGVHPHRIHVIRSHIDTHRFTPRNKSDLRKKHGLKPSQKIILYYGSLLKAKGVQTLLKAIPPIAQQNPDVLFIIAPRDRPAPHDLALMRSLPQTYLVLGGINAPDYVSLSDMVVLPYISLVGTEGNPSCMLEAMACKTPIVTTELPELSELTTSEVDVLMALPGDAPSLAAALSRLLGSASLRKKLADNAFRKSVAFDVRLISKEFEALYGSLVRASLAR